MLQIFSKLYLGNKYNCLEDIVKTYNKKGYVIVNYLYFANCMKYRLFEKKQNNTQATYYDSLLEGDFLLPDGIALQVFYYFSSFFYKNLDRKYPFNLNGTDFAPFVIENLKNSENINLIVYGAKQEVLNGSLKYIKEKFGIDPVYSQDGYSEFDFLGFEGKILEKYGSLEFDKYINIFLIGRGSPLQEIWLKNNIENIKKYKLMCFSQGGTFDFWGGVEKRAPGILVKLRVFETFWRILTNPKKNLPKFLSMFGVFRVIFKMIFGVIR